jgi:uncharacterized protein (TIGR02246 family)
VCAFCIALQFPFHTQMMWAQQPDEVAIRAVVDGFMDAWNRHDAKAFGSFFTPDADFTNWRGVGASGRDKIEEFHAKSFATLFKDSHQSHSDVKIRFIRPDVASVDVHWEMTGATDHQGNPRPPRNGLLSFVMVKDGSKWQIAVMHNLDISALPPPK